MNNINYFQIICFVWAFVGIGSRFLMIFMGDRWNKWELEKGYSEEKPNWVYYISIFALFIVGLTWYKVFTLDVHYSWIIAVIITLTLIKIVNILFNYKRFREFIKSILEDKRKILWLNMAVFLISLIFIFMGIFLY